MTDKQIEALNEMVDCLNEIVEIRMQSTEETRAEALGYITTYLEKMKGSCDQHHRRL